MAVEIEATIIVNLKIEAGDDDITTDQIVKAIHRESLENSDIESNIGVVSRSGRDLGWVDDNTSVYSYEIANWQVDNWRVVNQDGETIT